MLQDGSGTLRETLLGGGILLALTVGLVVFAQATTSAPSPSCGAGSGENLAANHHSGAVVAAMVSHCR